MQNRLNVLLRHFSYWNVLEVKIDTVNTKFLCLFPQKELLNYIVYIKIFNIKWSENYER